MQEYKLTKEAVIKGLGSIYYVSAPIDVSTGLLEEKNISHIPARDLAFGRVKKGVSHSLCQNGSYVKEGDLYVPEFNGVIWSRDSLVLKNPVGAVNAHRIGKEFFVDKKVSDEYVDKAKSGDKSVFVLKDFSAVPTNRFGEDERTVWLFQDMAEQYGLFLKNEGNISAMPFNFNSKDYVKSQGKPYVNQLWLGSLDDNSRVYGYYGLLYGYGRARGVRGESTRVASAQKISDDYTKKQLNNLSKVLHNQGITGDLEKRILSALKG